MAAEADIIVRQSDTYKVIHVTGEIMFTNYDGARISVLNDSSDLTKTLHGDSFKPSKVQIHRTIECELVLPPSRLKAWVHVLQRELARYEKSFGHVLSPEEIDTKMRDRSE